MAGAPRIDVQPTATRVPRIHRELERFAARPDVHEDALNTLLMKFIVISETHDVLKQARLVNLCARIRNLHTAPVGLPRHQTIAFEQMAHKSFCHGRFIVFCREQLGSRLILGALNVHAV